MPPHYCILKWSPIKSYVTFEHLNGIVPRVHEIALTLLKEKSKLANDYRSKLNLQEYLKKPEENFHRHLFEESRRTGKKPDCKQHGITLVSVEKHDPVH